MSIATRIVKCGKSKCQHVLHIHRCAKQYPFHALVCHMFSCMYSTGCSVVRLSLSITILALCLVS